MDRYVAAIDQGTTGTRCVVFDGAARVAGEDYRRHEQQYPEPGWVEHDPEEIWTRTKAALLGAIDDADVDADQLAALGVTNQRETTVLWDAATGEPVHRAIVWQDRRTEDRVDELVASGKREWIRRRTGLLPDAYFSATKIEWLLTEAPSLDGVPDDLRERAAAGEVLFGTVDSWLVFNLTGAHVTDVTNASRTMLFDVHDCRWDEDLLAEFGVPKAMLPAVRASSADGDYGTTDPGGFLGASVPVAAALGDQQAALFGQACFEAGEAKNTCGTGSFFLVNTGTDPVDSDHGLLTTVAFQLGDDRPRYALEGSIFATGAAVEWLTDVGLAEDPAEVEALARSVEDAGDVYLVPAFAGLGAPHWDGRARGTVVGLTRDTGRGHLARATLESVGFQTREVAEAVAADTGLDPDPLRVDGGAANNDLLCQLQADLVGTTVVRPGNRETTALGAAYAAGLAVDYWSSLDELRDHRRIDERFEPSMDSAAADDRYDRWGDAVACAKGWARGGGGSG